MIFFVTGGDIKVYRKEGLDSFKLIGEANDPEPIPVEYISFGSWNTNLVKFYFNCSFSFAKPDAVSATTEHPLLANDVPSTIDLRNCAYNFVIISPLSFSIASSLSLFLSIHIFSLPFAQTFDGQN